MDALTATATATVPVPLQLSELTGLLESELALAAIAGTLGVVAIGFLVLSWQSSVPVSRTIGGVVFGIPKRMLAGLVSVFIVDFDSSGGGLPTRTLVAVVSIIGGIAFAGLFQALTAGVSIHGSSGPIIRFILEWATNGWGIVLAAIFFARSMLFGFRKVLIRRSATAYGYATTTVQQLAAEARTADGSRSVFVFSGDDREDVADRIYDALIGDYDETLRRQQEEHADPEGEPIPDGGHDPDDNDDPDDRNDATDDADIFGNGDDSDVDYSELDDLFGDDPGDATLFEDATGGTDGGDGDGAGEPSEWDSPFDEAETDRDANADPDPDTRGLPSADADSRADESGDHDPGPGPASIDDDPAGDDDGQNLSFREKFRMWRLDMEASFKSREIVWRFLAPAAISYIIMLLVAQLWVIWWLYLVLGGLAVAIGGLYYAGSKWRRLRRLEQLRSTGGDSEWGDMTAVLAKRAETEDVTMYYLHIGGRVFANSNPRQLAETGADRALQRVEGYRMAPAIEERYAWFLSHYVPDLHGIRENIEKRRIQEEMVDAIRQSRDGLISKTQLAYEVIEHDRRTIWFGLRFVGFGHDPDLVAEVYREFVPIKLVEQKVTVTGPEGEDHTITVVYERDRALPPTTAKFQAKFEKRLKNHGLDSRYDLPDVDPMTMMVNEPADVDPDDVPTADVDATPLPEPEPDADADASTA